MKTGNKIKWWTWRMNNEEKANQIDGYNSLKLWQSYRGISVIFITISLLITLIFSLFDFYISIEDFLYSLIIYIPVLIFVYKGKRWAIILLMILYTFEKGYQIFEGTSVASSIFWFLLLMPFFWKALVVENLRRKQEAKKNKYNYCGNCGEKISEDNRFCSKCGNKTINRKKKKKFIYFLKIGASLLIVLLIGTLIFYTYKEDKNYVDNHEAESSTSLFEMFNPYIEPVGYYSKPELFDADNIEISEWWSYVTYLSKDSTQLTSSLVTNIPNQVDVLSSVVKIVCEDDDNYYTGSGTNFDASGYVLTNLHVVEGADQCAVGFVDAKSGLIKELYWATPIIDKENITGHDLAYLSVEEPIFDDELNVYGYFDKFSNSQLPYFKIKKECESKEIQLGDQIFVIGYPYLSGGALTITNGLVSSLYSEDGYIITSAKINSGNSGGLAIDHTGCYIGVPSAVYYEDGEESFGEIIDPEFVAEFDEAIADDLDAYINNL